MFSKILNKVRRNKFTVLITAFVVGLITITLGSALLNSVLTLTGTTKIKENRWLIHFEFVDNINASHPNTDSSKDARITDPTTKKENISFSTNFKDVGDFYEFNVYTWNEGTIDAVIDSLILDMPAAYKDNIKFTAYYDDSDIKTTDTVTYDINKVKNIYDSRYDYNKTEIEPCDALYKDTMRKIIVRAEYVKKIDNLDEDKNINFNFKINYVQEKTCENNPSTKRLLRIRPNGGTYNKTTTETKIYLNKDETYTVKTPTRDMYNFEGWEVISPTENGTYSFTGNTFKMGEENVILQAKWTEGDYVARIMNKYYPTIQEAFDDVDSKDWEDNTVWLLKDTTEYPVNTANNAFTFNLDGHTVTGTIQNNVGSNITLVNGLIKTEEKLPEEQKQGKALRLRHETAFINYGTLTLGINDTIVDIENSIALEGNEYGLLNFYDNNAKFNFYDGYIEGDIAIEEGYDKTPTGYYVFVDHNNTKDCQRAYLIPNPNRAVAKTTTKGTVYYYNMQDAINSVETYKKDKSTLTDNDYIITVTRDFEAGYPLSIESQRIFINIDGKDIQTGEAITNNGYLKIYNPDTNRSAISSSVSITNNNKLVIDNVSITSTTDDNVIENKANLTLTKSTITGKTGYGINNTASGVITADDDTYIKSNTTYGLNNTSDSLILGGGNYYGVKNSKILGIDGEAKIYKSDNTEAIKNTGTINMSGGTISGDDSQKLITNDETFNITGGTINNDGKSIVGGTVNVKGGTITSVNNYTIDAGKVIITAGQINNTNSYCVKAANADISGGQVNSENSRGISVDYTLNMTGGKVTAGTIGLYGNLVNISDGEVISSDIGAKTYTYYIYDTEYPGTVTITGGKVSGTNNGVYSDYVEMSGGTVTSSENIGITVNKNGHIVGGKIQGELYGVLDNNKLTIGEDDGTISITNPEIIGGSYGLYIPEGKELNFNDGILKGTIDGYSGIITNTPKGAVTVDDTETINEVLYNTDYLIVYEPWLEIEGKGTYNTIDDATRAAASGDVIKVIKSVDDSANGLPHITFKQSFADPNNTDKEVTFDLNGHTVRSTQPITNELKVTIVDSSENHTGTFKPKYGASIVNNQGATLTLNGGNYLSNLNEVIDNSGTMIVESAYFDVDNYGIFNHKTLIINDINIARSKIGVRQNKNAISSGGSTTMNGGIINASENGIQTGETWGQSYTAELNGGKIIAGKNGMSGSYGSKTVNGGEIIATEYGILSSDGSAVVTGGKITSLTKDGIYSAGGVYVTGGTIIGKEYGIRNYWHALAVGGEWCPITIEGGHIIGQTKDGINNGGTDSSSSGGADLLITGGKIEGKMDGVYSDGETTLGDDDGSISKTAPELVGHTKYALEVTKYTAFFDGILKAIPDEEAGRLDVYKGLISIIPDGSYIYEDFEINQQNGLEYQTRYLETKGDWLQIGDDESRRFNSLNAAYAAMTDSDTTIKVIATAYVNFKQKLPAGKNVILDMNNYSVVFTQPIEIENNTTVIDSGEDGYFNNLRDNVFLVKENGHLTISDGTFNSETSETIKVNAGGNLTINDGTYTSNGSNVLYNVGTSTINKGEFSTDSGDAIVNIKDLTIKNGYITTTKGNAVYTGTSGTTIIDGGELTGKIGIKSLGKLTINDGTITSTNKEALDVEGTTTINGGTITAQNNDAISSHKGTLTINNKKTIITSLNGMGIKNAGAWDGTANAIINDGIITGSTHGVFNNYEYSTMTINGGNIEGKNGVGVFARGTTTILGGTIIGGTNGVYANGNITIGNDDGTINIDSPSIRGELYGLYIEGDKLYFYDGILKGITERVNDYEKITKIPVGAEIIYSEETIDEKNYLTAYLYQEQDIARNLKSGKECPNALRVDDGICIYNNLQLAFTDASDGETIQILETARAVPIYYEVTNDKDVTLDLNGKTITSTKKITNNGKLIVTDSTNNGGTIRTSASANLITTSNELTLNNVTLINTSTYQNVVNSTGKVTVNNSTIQSIEGIYSTGEIVVNNSNFTTTNTGIHANGKLTVNGGTYKSNGYAIYANTTGDVNIDGVTITGNIYDGGNNTATVQNTIINGNLQNYSNMTVLKGTTQTKIYNGVYNNSSLVVNEAYIKNGVSNGGTTTINKCLLESGRVNNFSNITINDSTFNTYVDEPSYFYVSGAISNSGTATINNTVTNLSVGRYAIGYDNSGTLNINDNTTMTITNGTNTYGIRNNNNGKVNISSGTITLTGSYNEYGIYSIGENAKVTLINGKIEAKNANTTYGAYLKYGTLEMGVRDGSGLATADVSLTNPLVVSTGTNGTGVKKEYGFFNFYDGKIWGSKYAKPETVSNIEYKWEATTYIDEETGYEYTILEYMPNDYQLEEVALLRGVAYSTVQGAIDRAEDGDVIKLVRSTAEENIVIPSTKNIIINLNKYTITGKITNDGTVNIYNGTLTNHDDAALVNNGTFVMGDSTDPISGANVRILSDKTAVVSTGTFVMYDGYIEGNPSINGDINTIPPLSRIRTSKNDQRERKTLQSLDEQSIIDGETDLRITIDPNTGYYDNRNVVQEVYLQHLHTYDLNQHTIKKDGCDFDGWEVSDPDSYNDGVITVNLTDITVKAKWKVKATTVAQIGTEYYDTLADAIFHAKRGDKVILLKDTTEDITNDKDITIDLNEHKVTGAFINNGILIVNNGTIENTRTIDDPTVEDADEVGIAIINNKSLTLGNINDRVYGEGIIIKGTSMGIKNNGKLYFYDGYVQGKIGISGNIEKTPQGYYVYNKYEDIDNVQYQIVYLDGSPENAEAETRVHGTQYYFKLQDAVNSSTVTGYEIYLRKDIDSPSYDLVIPEDSNIVINMEGHTYGTGRSITNNGTLKLYSNKTDDESAIGTINTTNKVLNNGTLYLEKVNINENANNYYGIENKGILDIKKSNVNAKNYSGVYTDGELTIDSDTVLSADSSYGINNNQTKTLTIDKGKVYSIYNSKSLVIDGTANIESHGGQPAIYIDAQDASLVVNDGTIYGNDGAYAIRDTSSKTSIEINGGSITTSGDYTAIRVDNGNDYTFTMNDGELYGYHAMYFSNYGNPTVNINGGKISCVAGQDVLLLSGGTLNMTGGEITSSNSYAIWAQYTNYSNIFNINGGLIKGTNGIGTNNTDGEFNIKGGEINVTGTAIYAAKNINISGGLIKSTGDSSSAILAERNSININMTGGTIEAENIGVKISNNNTVKFNMKTGSIKGNTYGIHQNDSNSTVNIGVSDDELSTSIPYITGGTYGIYKESGTLNFNNGKLRGKTNGNNDSINNLRKGHDLITETEKDNNYITNPTNSVSIYSNTALSDTPKAGNGYARITYEGELPETNDEETCESLVGKKIIFESEEESQKFTAHCGGTYKLEVWGAQGGYRSLESNGGKGGYSTGTISLKKNDNLYVYVGSSGNNGGYNGGGSREIGHNGGGATDIRITKDDLYSRIIVAGGGGSDGAGNRPGGYAGGLTGQSRNESYGSGGSGATQTSGGSYRGEFGKGGDGNDVNGGHAGAGGGGWYGGGGSNPDGSSDDDRGGGGGSSFVYTDDATLPEGYNAPERFKLSDTSLKAGNQTMPSPLGNEEITGNTGDGYAIITLTELDSESQGQSFQIENQTVYNFKYRENESEFVAPYTGKYKLEVWGAAGGYLDENKHGGYGAYSKGEIILNKKEKLYINVGGQGGSSNGTGGYNGGGSGGSSGGSGGGGGATHIATKSGLLSTLEDSKSSVIIVAGGGGGYASYGCSTAIGGSGGGIMGAPYKYGGTQTSGGPSNGQTGGSFGKGGYQSNSNNSTPGGGAGWYGGGTSSNLCGAGGGSGYTGNTRLTNTLMVGYNIDNGDYYINYLAQKEAFLRVNDKLFNSFEEAIEEAGTRGTIYLLKNVNVSETLTVAENTNITLNLQEYKLEMTSSIVNNGTLSILDSEDSNGGIETTGANLIENNGVLLLTDIYLSAPDKTVVNSSGLSTVTVNNCQISGSNGFSSTTAELLIEDSNIDVTGTAIYTNTETRSNITLRNTDITAVTGIDAGSYKFTDLKIYSSNLVTTGYTYSSNYGSGNVLIENSNLKSTNNYTIYDNCATNFTINNSIIESTNKGAIRNNNGGTPDVSKITGGKLIGTTYSLYLDTSTAYSLNGVEVICNGNGSNVYAIEGGTVTINNSTITASNCSGITSRLILNSGTIIAKYNGIYSANKNATINNGSITGKQYAILANGNTSIITINGGTITNENGIAIALSANNNYSKTLNINGGTIIGKTYGVTVGDNSTVNVGNKDAALSIEIPYIVGGDYAINNTSGTFNFYNGRLRGNIMGYNGEYNYLRSGKKIYTQQEIDESVSNATVSTNTVSDTPEENTPKNGNGYAKITYIGSETVDCSELVGHVYTFTTKTDAQKFTAQCDGNYKVELWGAQGGNNNENYGKGAYTTGVISLNENDDLYVNVGGKGGATRASVSELISGGYNGGGYTNGQDCCGRTYGSGGGATDIRYYVNTPSQEDLDSLSDIGLKSRIMVAAGGGGGYNGSNGGNAGTLKGQNGQTNNGYGPGPGATQLSGGINTYAQGASGSFGQGGFGGNAGMSTGGGGGYYGGAGSFHIDAAGGGSSYISGYKGSIAITSLSSLAARNDSNGTQCTENSAKNDSKCSEHFSGKVFTSTSMKAGNEEMPTHLGDSTMVGNTGDGYATITYLGGASSSNNSGICSNASKEFDYTGNEQEFIASCAGEYKLEVWGASGGSYDETYHGGYGGYSRGNITLSSGEKLYVNVGGAGIHVGGNNTAQGGYNGGGSVIKSWGDGNERRSTGGGATHIATTSGILSSLENKKDKILIVAGGGGGAQVNAAIIDSAHGVAGSGGGYTGGTGYQNDDSNYITTATGGTQTSGGVFTTTDFSDDYSGYAGTFGQGGPISDEGNYAGLQSGGGGGYYGGAASFRSAGGGSGYLSNELTDSVMYGYEVQSTSDSYVINYLTDRDGFLEVNGQVYNSLNSAIAAIDDVGTIKVLNSNTLTEDSIIPSGKNITINLNGKEIISNGSITNNGDLTIVDSSNEKGLLNLKNKSLMNNGNLTLSGSKVKSSGTVIVAKTGTGKTELKNNAELSGSTGISVESKQQIVVKNSTINIDSTSGKGLYIGVSSIQVDIEGTTITSNSNGLECSGNGNTINLKNNTFNVATTVLSNSGSGTKSTYTITGGTYSSSGGKIIGVSGANITINGGTYTTNSTDVAVSMSGSSITLNNGASISAPQAKGFQISSSGNPSVTINDSTITTYNRAFNFSTWNSYENPSVTLNSGTIETTGTDAAIYNGDTHTTFTMNGGTVKSQGAAIDFGGGTGGYKSILNLYSGTIIGGTYGVKIHNASTNVTIGKQNEFSDELPLIQGELYGLENSSCSNIYLYGGKIMGISGATSADINNVKSYYQITHENVETADNKTYDAAYLIPMDDFVKNLSQNDALYSDLQTAITEASDGDVLQILSSKTLTSSISIPNGKNLTIDLNGNTLTFVDTITNEGTLNIKNDLANSTGKLYGYSNNTFITNNGTLNVKDSIIEGYTAISNNGTLNVKDSIIEGYTAISNNGKFTLDNSEIIGRLYAIYSSSSSVDNTIVDSKLRITNKDNVVLYNYNSVGKIEVNNTEILGKITNRGTLNITGNKYDGSIYNDYGTLRVSGVTMSNVYSDNNVYGCIIDNAGSLTILNSVINLNIYSSGADYYGIYNNTSSTMTSSGNNYNVNIKVSGSNHVIAAIGNKNTLTSSDDTIRIISVDGGYGNNVNGIYNTGTVSDTYVATLNNIDIDVKGATTSSGIKSYTGNTIINGGNINVTGTTNSYGIYLLGGTGTLKSGNITVNAQNTYGVKVDDGSFTIGVKETDPNKIGTSNADVSTTNPLIKSLGTTSGIGISFGTNVFNYYDGKILASTSPRVAGEYLNETEEEFIVSTEVDSETNYNYCILKFNR